MIRIQMIKPKTFILLWIVLLIEVLLTILCGAPALLMIVVALWSTLFVINANDISRNISTLCFLLSFYVFLIGREVCFYYLKVEIYYKYLTSENTFAYLCLIISLIGVWFGKTIERKNESTKDTIQTAYNYNDTLFIRKISKIIFYFCFVFQTLATILQIIYVRSVGYIESYSEEAGGAGIPAVISYLGAFMPIAFCLFIATKPPKDVARFPIILYEVYAILTVFSGRRYPFVAISLLLLVYMVFRNREERGWITRRMIVFVSVMSPILIMFLTAYDSIRTGESFSFNGIINTIVGFFDSQGGSINVIKRVAYYAEDIADLKWCSFDSTRTLLFENLISRHLNNATVFSGNSVEHALKGHSLAHRLSYYTYGNGYLLGRGTGSCFIAELVHDFGYIGVFVGSFVYGKFLKYIDSMSFSHPFKDGIVFAIFYYILLAPRGGFDGFVGNVFGIYSLLGYAIIFVIVNIMKRNHPYFQNIRSNYNRS